MGRLIFRFYQVLISPLLHWVTGPASGCRFEPSCSSYAETAIKEWGWFRGVGMGLIRILKCHPFHRGGFDPVPEKKSDR